jgi:hypothetical protein
MSDHHSLPTALDRTHAYKPLDFGNGRVAGSVSDQGRLIALNTAHPRHGYVTLTCVPPFPDDRWYDPAYVRRYRAALAAPDLPGIGFTFLGTAHYPSTCALVADALPRVHLTIAPNITVEIVTFAPSLDGAPAAGAVQICTLTNQRDEPYELSYSWGGTLSLTRSSYAQLTEGGPIPRPPDAYVVAQADQQLTIENSGLGWAVAVRGIPTHQERPSGGMPNIQLDGVLWHEPHATQRMVVAYGFGATGVDAERQAADLAGLDSGKLLDETVRSWEEMTALVTATEPPEAAWLTARAITYVLACCAVPVGEAMCVITDHQLLPLAWTRDAYYEIQPLLGLRQHAHNVGGRGAALRAAIEALVQRHLIWLFETAERPDGMWGRAYLTNGHCKDRVFQLDQQCYPLLELADYCTMTGDTALVTRLRGHVGPLIELLMQRRAADAWLFPTSETPADDQVEMPYHLSSQIVVWRTFRALASLNAHVAFTDRDLANAAEQVRRAVYRHMVVVHAGQPLFCYLTDLQGGYRLYHDANDLPTALAPVWGFCSSDDPIWRATIAFAYSEANVGGYYSGRYPGLGSVHTPHPWPLGAVQALLVAGLLRDAPWRERAWRTLHDRACWDGMLCEAYDEATGAVASRHWFAWPGAALAMLALAGIH